MSLPDPVKGFENIPVLKAEFQAKIFCSLPERQSEGFPVRLYRNIHFIDHGVTGRIIASPKERPKVSDVCPKARHYLGDARNQAHTIRSPRGYYKGFADRR